MRRLIIQSAAIAVLSSLHACRPAPTTYTVVLVDVSKSITRDSFESEFKIANDLVDQMGRGDRLTLIPITGNADAETSGHVLTILAPSHRQAYDADLTAFREVSHRNIAKLRDRSNANMANRTDILGALNLAQEEFNAITEDSRAPNLRMSLYVLSDFVEDDGTYRFASPGQMISRCDPSSLATRLKGEHHFSLPTSTNVKLIKLQNGDAQRFDARTQDWIRAFWSVYLTPSDVRWMPLDVEVAERKM